MFLWPGCQLSITAERNTQTWPVWKTSKRRRQSWAWLMNRAGGLVCPELLGNGPTRVTPLSECGKKESQMAMDMNGVHLLDQQGGTISLVTENSRSSVQVSKNISRQCAKQIASLICVELNSSRRQRFGIKLISFDWLMKTSNQRLLCTF